VLHGIRTFIPIMLEQAEEGHIVNTSSLAGLGPGGGSYGASKHAVVSLSESLYLHLKMIQSKIGVSVLCPGFVSTNIADAERNRPAGLENADEDPITPFEQALADRIADQIRTGRPPAEVADIVLEAIRNEQFWITTTDEFDDIVRTRHEGIMSRTNPVMPAGLT
jgi:NAD(P)-dependent dehydrogenase (short-subunit alcohol dehydrogenase family)